MSEVETRCFTDKAELRFVEEDGVRKFVGYAAVFNSLSHDLGGFREKINPGAFKRAIQAQQDVKALFNHDDNVILGRSSAGTLSLAEDAYGLRYEVPYDETDPDHQRVMSKVKRGDIRGSSFAFRVNGKSGERWERRNENGVDVRERTLLDLDLFDVSPVTTPAYPATDVAVRSMKQWEQEEFDQMADNERRLNLAERD